MIWHECDVGAPHIVDLFTISSRHAHPHATQMRPPMPLCVSATGVVGVLEQSNIVPKAGTAACNVALASVRNELATLTT